MMLLKKVIFFLFCIVSTLQLAYSQSNITILRKADSLFAIQKFAQAEQLYRFIDFGAKEINPNIYLKLASIQSENNNYAEELYFLTLYHEATNDERILQKTNEIAETHQLKGYELSDFNFLILIYKQYSFYLFGVLFIIGLYIFGVLLFKRIRLTASPVYQKLYLSLYLMALLLLINLPNSYYRQAITKHDKILLRPEPTSVLAPIYEVSKGHRINVLGDSDIWLRVLWEGEIVYLKKSDVWLVN
jgi:hypothetical protein